MQSWPNIGGCSSQYEATRYAIFREARLLDSVEIDRQFQQWFPAQTALRRADFQRGNGLRVQVRVLLCGAYDGQESTNSISQGGESGPQ